MCTLTKKNAHAVPKRKRFFGKTMLWSYCFFLERETDQKVASLVNLLHLFSFAASSWAQHTAANAFLFYIDYNMNMITVLTLNP